MTLKLGMVGGGHPRVRARHSQQRIGPASDPAEDHIAEPCQHEARHAKGQQDQESRARSRVGTGRRWSAPDCPIPQASLLLSRVPRRQSRQTSPPFPLREQVARRAGAGPVLAPVIETLKKGHLPTCRP